LLIRLAKRIASAPDRLNVVYAACLAELFAELADEHVDDLLVRLVHAALELVEEHLFRDRMEV